MPETTQNPLIKGLLLAIGWLSVVLGVLGIFLPVLPTTPFLLLAAGCFARTSPRFYQWLVAHPRLGQYLVYYLDGKGMPLKAKVYTLLLMWSMLLLTAFVLVQRPMLHYLLPAIGFCVSVYILRLPTMTVGSHSLPTTDKQDTDMHFLRSFLARHGDWMACLILALVFVLVPELDLMVSSWFYDPATQRWWGEDSAVAISIYGIFRYLPYLLVPVLLVATVLAVGRWGIDQASRRMIVFLLVTLLAGPGILVHSVFKEGFDRARPKNVEQFDGHKTFTPAFVVSQHCDRGCNSFVSGHAAMGFWLMAFGWVFGRGWFWAGVALGVVLSVTRIIQGGHFVSDTLFAGFLCYFTFRVAGAWILDRSRPLA